MFGNLGLHVMQFPSGKWGYRGSVPSILGTEVPATTNDILGCRTHRDANGKPAVWNFPVFETCSAAVEFAKARGCEIRQRDELPL